MMEAKKQPIVFDEDSSELSPAIGKAQDYGYATCKMNIEEVKYQLWRKSLDRM